MSKNHTFHAARALAGSVLSICLATPGFVTAADLNPPLSCPSATARPVQVCFALDASSSIGSTEYANMKKAVARATSAVSSVPQDGSVSLSFVIFGNYAAVTLPMTRITSQTVASQVANAVTAFPYPGGATAIGDAIALCALQFQFAPGQRHIINVVTDAVESGYVRTPVVEARDIAVEMGVNVINGLGIGRTESVRDGLKKFVWPAPASAFPADGFAELIQNWSMFPESVAGMMSASTFLFSSSGPGYATPIAGPLSTQLSRLNSAPPAFDATSWRPVYRKSDVRASRAFRCQEVADPLDRSGALKLGYVSADTPMPRVDEVTYNNCTSAFYRFTFALPKGISQICLNGRANVDDMAVAYLNNTRLSPTVAASDLQRDRYDSAGRPIISWPSQDQFGTSDRSLFRMGAINELVFGVIGDVSIEPTGVEFQAKISALTIPFPTVFAINRGAASTTNRTVSLHNTASEQPLYYMASESASFVGATWTPYSTAPQFVLNAVKGTHTVYLKFKGKNGVSSVRSDTIVLR